MVALFDKRRWQIRRIFLQRREDYSPMDAGKLLSMRWGEIVRRIELGELDATKNGSDYRVPWEAVADLALRTWTLEVIYDALGTDADAVLPPLLRVEEMRVQLPVYLIRLMKHLADGKDVSLDEFMRAELHDFANAMRIVTPELDDELPGFAEAMFFPDRVRVPK